MVQIYLTTISGLKDISLSVDPATTTRQLNDSIHSRLPQTVSRRCVITTVDGVPIVDRPTVGHLLHLVPDDCGSGSGSGSGSGRNSMDWHGGGAGGQGQREPEDVVRNPVEDAETHPPDGGRDEACGKGENSWLAWHWWYCWHREAAGTHPGQA
ncbi:unnamed protein product [[Candida] boidinii]|nr:unnamed protein product [[Candida] boidinii]